MSRTADPEGLEANSSPTLSSVIATVNAEIRTFLYELAEGTTKYRSLHSLTEQVEHQYHGRFIVELIQNAHDALLPIDATTDHTGRIEIVLKSEGPFGTLYVANDGRPFSESNFKSLSRLGQSDKSPQESIGNKGIGFRSVLEITDSPEIHSRGTADFPLFDGFCFGFSPDIIQKLEPLVHAMVHGDDNALSPFGHFPLVDWDPQLLVKFRATVQRAARTGGTTAKEWVSGEMRYLSPYLLPFPVNGKSRSPHVAGFEGRGFATVIRFPLKSAAASALVHKKLEELDDGALLFLERASSLTLDSGLHRRVLTRSEKERAESAWNGRAIRISREGSDSTRHYWTWTRELSLPKCTHEVQAAVRQLPGKWPLLEDAAVSIAVRVLDEEPQPGTFSIFLPTPLSTGCAVLINAPFFGDMSRTHIDFGTEDDPSSSHAAVYNRFLLSEAARLAVYVVAQELAGRGDDEARAVVDLLAPCGGDQDAAKNWQSLTAGVVSAVGAEITAEPWFLSDQGWAALATVSLLPELTDPAVIAPRVLRRNGVFPAYSECLDSRRRLIAALSTAHEIGWGPATADLADTVEAIAAQLHGESDPDWNGFWSDITQLFDGDLSPLAGKRVLIGRDGQLHSGGSEDCTVFFIPRRHIGDVEDGSDIGDIKDVPVQLRPFVAFLSDAVRLQEEKSGRPTPLLSPLVKGELIKEFQPEEILTEVLIARTPSLPLPLKDPQADICRDILLWALRLVAHPAEGRKGTNFHHLLAGLPAPCKGGWFPLGETAFGPGWQQTNGGVAEAYLTRVKTKETREARRRLLLAPADERWGRNGASHLTLLRLVGVFDGVRLVQIVPESWSSDFEVYQWGCSFPRAVPPGVSEQNWSEYHAMASPQVKPAYNSGHYQVQEFKAFPGLNEYREFDEGARLALSNVVLASAGQWDDGWETLTIFRVKGNSDALRLQSPLSHSLTTLPWLGLTESGTINWYQPKDRWHVPAVELARNRKWQFDHLRPLPVELATRLDATPRLAGVMQRLGTPRYDPETRSPSTQLLDALTDAVAREDVPNRDAFLGQVRSAWRGLEPSGGSPFPQRLLVQQRRASLVVVVPDPTSPVYLPDSTKSFVSALRNFSLPVIAIEPEDAKRLADAFTEAFPASVLLASELTPSPLVDGNPWEGSPQERLRDNPELEWAIPVLLTIAAFHGSSGQGTTSKAFRKHVEAFREAGLTVVGSLRGALFREETQVAEPLPLPAMWVDDRETLLLAEDWPNDMAATSEAFANLLEREDLEVPIKLVLGHTGSKPEPAAIVHALGQLKLSEEHYRDVREHWRGDLSQIIEQLVPLLGVLQREDCIPGLLELDTDEAVINFLDHLAIENLDGATVVKLARDSRGMRDFGSNTSACFDGAFEMSNWNAFLSSRGEPPLRNTDAQSAFAAHLAASAQPLRSLLATLLAREPGIGRFKELLAQLESLDCPPEFETAYWEVTYGRTLSAVVPLFRLWKASAEEVAAIQAAASIGDLADRLAHAGVRRDFDPVQAARDNRASLERIAKELQRVGVAWALQSAQPSPEAWEGKADGYVAFLVEQASNSLFTGFLSEQDTWSLAQQIPADPTGTTFASTVSAASGIADLVARLGLSSEALDTASSKLEKLRELTQRRRKQIDVCGAQFDGSEENLSGLWSHICERVPTAALDNLPPVDLGETSPLRNLALRGKGARKEGPPIAKAPKQKHLSKLMENLIGLSGEIHAFRMLQAQYGVAVVSPSAWVSGNSAMAFPDKTTDDGYGCDFVIRLPSGTCYVEVKSSEADQESFTMGSSEIRLARELARRSRRRGKSEFQILRVSNALSMQPGFQLLPNPFDPKHQGQFVIEDADARVRYRSRK